MNFIYFYIILSIILSFFQCYVNYDFIILILIEYAVLEKNFNRGMLVSSFLGFVQDISIGSILGLNLFIKSLIFYVLFSLKEKLFLKNFIIKVIISWLLISFEVFFRYYSYKLFSIPILPPNLYNYLGFIIISPLFFIILNFFEYNFVKTDEI